MAAPEDDGFGERLQELEALRSMFTEEELLVEDSDFSDPAIAPQVLALLDLHLSICLGSPPVKLSVTLPHDYPEKSRPILRLEASGAPKADIEAMVSSLSAAAAEHAGEVCVYDLCVKMQEELLPTAPWLQGGQVDVSRAGSVAQEAEVDQAEETLVAVIRIDHMNDSGAYCKKLREWARQVGLWGALFFRIPDKSSRWEDIFLFLTCASHDGLSSFVNNLRTQHVDKNSRGAKCKERKSEILFRGSFKIPLEGNSWPWEAGVPGSGGAAIASASRSARAEVLPDLEYTSCEAAQATLVASLRFVGLEAPAGLAASVVETAAKSASLGGPVVRDCAKGIGCLIAVAVRPNAKQGSQITNAALLVAGLADCIRVDVAAAPKEGEANRELCTFLARALGVSKGSVSVARGGASKSKEVFVEGLLAKDVLGRLADSAGAGKTESP